MKITEMDNRLLISGLDISSAPETKASKNDTTVNFMDYLKGALGEVDALQKEAAANAEKLALGDESYLHNTIISYEKATLALQLAIEVRNKMLDAYQEIMRIQM